jgi:hypothetical protein
MAVLKNAKHELFAMKIMKGLSPNEAYTSIFGPSPSVPQNASRLRARQDVAARIDELRGEFVAKLEAGNQPIDFSRDLVLRGLHHEATTSESGAARVRALELIGKIIGIEGLGGSHPITHDPSQMSLAELRQALAAMRAMG